MSCARPRALDRKPETEAGLTVATASRREAIEFRRTVLALDRLQDVAQALERVAAALRSRIERPGLPAARLGLHLMSGHPSSRVRDRTEVPAYARFAPFSARYRTLAEGGTRRKELHGSGDTPVAQGPTDRNSSARRRVDATRVDKT